MRKVKVFISYTWKDSHFVFKLAEKLQNDLKDFVYIFIYEWKIKVGDSIVDKINEALKETDFFIIVLSQNSLHSTWVKRELDTAISLLTEKKIVILPVWLGISEYEVPPLIRPIKAARFKSLTDWDEDEYKKLLEPIKDEAEAASILKFQDSFLGNIKHIDIIAKKKEPTIDEVKFVLNLMERDPSYERYVFHTLISPVWLEIWKSRGYLSPEKVPGPIPADKEGLFLIPYWSPLHYLEEISAYINKEKTIWEEKVKYAKELLEIIRNVSTYKDSEGNHIDNYHVWTSFVKILSNIPNELIDIETIDLIPIWLDSEFPNDLQAEGIIKKLLPKFFTDIAEDIKKAERVVQHITVVKIIPKGEEKEKVLIVNPQYIKEVFTNHDEVKVEKFSVGIIEDLKVKIKSLLRDETEGTFLSFYGNHFLDSPVEILSYGLRKIMIAKAHQEPEKLKSILIEFFKDSNFIFPKIALFVVAENIDNFKDLFWEIMDTSVGINIFKNTVFWGDELKHVLQNLGTLSDQQREILEEKINAACDELRKEKDVEDQEEVEKIVSLRKQKIYKALSYDEHFKTLYEEIKSTTKMDVELESAIVRVETEVKGGWGKSPLSENEILKLPNDELAGYLAEFKTEDFWEGPTIEALAETLKKAVKINPKKFTENLKPFMNTGYLYVYELLNGFNDALKEGKSVNMEEVFNFILDYIDRDEFWENKLVVHPEVSQREATYEWIISSIHFLITGIIKHKFSTITKDLVNMIEKVVLQILEKIDYGATGDVDDYVDYSLNSTLGRIIESYIGLILQGENSLISDEKISRFKNQYEGFFDKNLIEAYTLFGVHFLQFYHFLKGWTEKQVKLLENIKHTPPWEAFMTGYLFNNRIDKGIYELLRKHYKLSINYDFKSREAIRGLIAHISIAYLHGEESLESSSLFYEIVKDLNTAYIVEIINFFWRIGSDEEKIKNYRDKVLDFWRYIYGELKHKMDNDALTRQDKEILSELSKLIIFLPSITEEYKEWLLLTALHVAETGYNTITFWEYLDNLKNKGDKSSIAKYIGEIFLKMIKEHGEEKLPPNYPVGNIKSIVEFLFSTSVTSKIAIEICEIYLRRNLLFLKEICEKYGSMEFES